MSVLGTDQTAMHGEDLLIDDSSYGQAVEAVRERLPQLDIIASFAYRWESVHTVTESPWHSHSS